MRLLERVIVLAGMLIIMGTSCAACFPSIVRDVTVLPAEPKYYQSIAMIVTVPISDKFGAISGTAWAFDDDHLFTAGHVCEGFREQLSKGEVAPLMKVILAGRDGTPAYATEAMVILSEYNNDKEQDYCILYSKGHSLVPLKLSERFALVDTEDRVVIPGAPHGLFPFRVEGFVAEKVIYQINSRDRMLISAETRPGNSGSPVIWNGEVIGMVVAGFTFMDQGCIAINVLALDKFKKRAIGA